MAFVIFSRSMAKLKRESVLWSVVHPSQDHTSYIMGTMHLKDYNAYTYVTLAEKYLKLCSSYAGEMHLDEASSANLHQYFKLDEGQLLSDFYTAKQYERMSKVFFKITGATLDQLSDLKSMAISNIIAESYTYEDYGLALDHHLWNYALKLDKVVHGLETVQEQIDILESIPLSQQIRSLKQMLRNVSKHGNMVKSLGALYAEGKIHKLYRKSKKSLGALKGLMLYDRNVNMVSRFCSLDNKQSLFASIGAAHLSGSKGMLHLLKLQGYAITPIYE